MKKVKILIADDHTMIREGLTAILKMYDDMEVIGEANDGLEVIDKADSLHPDVVLMDIAMPGLGGLEATIEIKKRHREIKILVLTQYKDREYVNRFLKAGVSGYILKKARADELVNAIRTVYKGESYLDPAVTDEVIDGYLKKSSGEEETDPYNSLTDREKQILKLVAEGKTHKDIAQLLDISAKTVVTHQTHVSEKTGLHTKADLVKYAIKKGIIKIDT